MMQTWENGEKSNFGPKNENNFWSSNVNEKNFVNPCRARLIKGVRGVSRTLPSIYDETFSRKEIVNG